MCRFLLILVLSCVPPLARAQIEPVLLTDAQRARIDAAIAQFPPRTAGGSRAYFLGFAGYGDQRVFGEEIKLAAEKVGAKYGSTPRTLLLINDRRDLEKYPLATVSALRHALLGLGKVMDRERDVLFLALSSHGAPGAVIEVSNTDIPARGLGADVLAQLLRESGIRWRVIVVSACFSGAFVKPLADDHTIVLTAASKRRASFGCADDRDLTYFGEALYRDALPDAPNLRAAFEAARLKIQQREKQERVRPSHPQAFFGELMEPKLEHSDVSPSTREKEAGAGPYATPAPPPG